MWLNLLRKHGTLLAAGPFTAELDSLEVPLFQVDAHNIVPVWEASDKKEVHK